MATYVSMTHGLVVLLLVMTCLVCAKAQVHTTRQHLEVQRYLKKLNKPAIKSIKSPDGDIIDCVHISHQPAFDHPLLKNHTIQMRPTFQPFSLYDENKMESNEKTRSIAQLWHQNGRCPKDTIPIRRTRKDDVLRASSIERYGKKRHNAIPSPISVLNGGPVHEHSYAYVKGDKYYGTTVFLDVWNPYVQSPNEFSNAQLWILGEPWEDLNTVEVGWHVYPNLYGDNRTRLFVYWTSDNYGRTGCHNLLCSGFIQLNNEIALGSSLQPVSIYGGQQYGISLTVFKDPTTGNWWLQYGENGELGYWPSSLFNHLSYGTTVEWGAEIINSKLNGEHTSTVMGSGHFAEEGSGKASFCGNIQILDESFNQKDPQEITIVVEAPNCYNAINAPNSGSSRTHFFYGGPGKNPNCP